MEGKKKVKARKQHRIVEKLLTLPLYHLPKYNDMYFCFFFNKENKSLEICQMKEEFEKPLEYSIDKYPIEKCKKCECELMIDNCFYISDNKDIIYYCSNCQKNKGAATKLEKMKIPFSKNSADLLSKLNSYLENNGKNAGNILVKEMEKLITLTNSMLYFLDLLEKENLFETQVQYLINFRDSFIDYFDIVDRIRMNDLYLFLKNFCVVGIYKYSNNLITDFFENIYGKLISFNVSEIQLFIMNKLFDKVKLEEKVNNYFKKLEIKNGNFAEKEYRIDLNEANIQYLLLDNSLTQNNLLAFKNETKIKEIKEKLSYYLRNYFHSFDYISSKKVLERKLINSIIFLLFKNHSSLFKKIEFTSSIMFSLIKELKDILKFLGNSSKKSPLYKKIKKEIEYFEKFKKNENYNSEYLISNDKLKIRHIFLTLEEKNILKKYSSENNEDSYTTIYASKITKNPLVTPEHLQIILEFLFFSREKTINTIHILKKDALFFFGYLKEDGLKSEEGKSDEIYLTNSIDNSKKDEDILEELKNYSKPKDSKNADIINKKVFELLKINPKEEINSHSAFEYIFNYKPKEDYYKEIEFLYEKVVMPLDNIIPKENDIDSFERNQWKNLESKIQYIYDKIDNKFKDNPNYQIIHNYLDNANKIGKNNIPNIIPFYEKYVDGFTTLRELHTLKIKTNQKIMMIKETISNLDKLQSIKEKYEFILKEAKKYLGFNIEEYSKYYNEWEKKNPEFADENYKFEDLIKDLKILIPDNERIKIAGKDKKNFILILFLFQNNYFLKDYI